VQAYRKLDASVSAFGVARHLHLTQHFAAALIDRAVLERFLWWSQSGSAQRSRLSRGIHSLSRRSAHSHRQMQPPLWWVRL